MDDPEPSHEDNELVSGDSGAFPLVPDDAADGEVVDAELIPDLIKYVQAKTARKVALSMRSHSGPLPSPEVMRGYGEVLPDAPDRIIRMAEKSLDHRIEIEGRESRIDSLLGVLGLVFAFLLALFVFGLSGWLISDGKQVAGTIIATVDIVALVGIFIYGRRRLGEAQPVADSSG